MSGDRETDAGRFDFTRRTFMKASGAAAGAGVLGLGAGTAAADEGGFDPAFANWRVREASKVWERDYTGRHDRTIGLTDSGIEARHPDLGPWNGVKAETSDSGLVLKSVDSEMQPVAVTDPKALATRSFSGTTGPGAGVVGLISTTSKFTIGSKGEEAEDGTTIEQLSATLTWNTDTPGPQPNDADFELLDADGNVVASSGSGGTETQASNTESLTLGPDGIDPDGTYQFQVTSWRGVVNWSIESVTQELVDTGETERKEVVTTSDLADDVGVFDDPSNKTFGWYDAGPRYGSFDRPRDGNGHGTHCTSIMGGSGRASTVDEANLTQEEPRAALIPGDFLEYEIPVDAAGGVFVAAYGENVEVSIEGPDGKTIETGGVNADHSLSDNTLIDHPAVHGEGTATYTAYVKPLAEPETGTATVGRANRVAAGPLLPPAKAGDGSRDGGTSLHAGLAPDAGLVGLQGLSAPTADLGEYAGEFASAFKMRAVNMSWGYAGGAPIGAAGGRVSEAAFGENLAVRLRQIAKGGILPVAAAGNAATPANGNGDPAVHDEAISVAATDPIDGLTSYSSGGVGGLEEAGDETDESQYHRKPDVSAPGGAADGFPGGVYDLVRAAKNGDPNASEDGQRIRDYTLKAGTSMASPYVCGVSGLVAEAMDETHGDAPSSIALPSPTEAGYDDVMRLKQVLLATATETAFTAAPYHHPTHTPTYEGGDRDPYEGYGRVNPDAAVDAVSNDLFATDSPAFEVEDAAAVAPLDTDDDGNEVPKKTSVSLSGAVGLNVPDDARALAGYVEAKGGTLDVSVGVSHLSGGNKGMAKGSPHVDLFIYDAESPAANGEPSVVASAQGTQGSASTSVDVAPREFEGDERNTRTFYVVAKLVNVPGVVNGYDVQANLDLDLEFTAAAVDVEPKPEFSATGGRSSGGSVFTKGQTDTVTVSLDSVSLDRNASLADSDTVTITDEVPTGWTVTPFADAKNDSAVQGPTTVQLGTATVSEIESGSVDRTYIVEATGDTGPTTFGAASAKLSTVVDTQNTTDSFGGTATKTIVGVDQNDPVGSTTDGASSGSGSTSSGTTGSGSGDGGSLTDTVSDTL